MVATRHRPGAGHVRPGGDPRARGGRLGGAGPHPQPAGHAPPPVAAAAPGCRRRGRAGHGRQRRPGADRLRPGPTGPVGPHPANHDPGQRRRRRVAGGAHQGRHRRPRGAGRRRAHRGRGRPVAAGGDPVGQGRLGHRRPAGPRRHPHRGADRRVGRGQVHPRQRPGADRGGRRGRVRAGDSKGRHTTTHRELHLLDGGGVLVDTPGIREVGIFADPDAVAETFPEIDELTEQCRFSDCAHQREPGCAVLAAVADGTLDADRLAQWRDLEAEAAASALRPTRSYRRSNRQFGKAWSRSTRTPRSTSAGEASPGPLTTHLTVRQVGPLDRPVTSGFDPAARDPLVRRSHRPAHRPRRALRDRGGGGPRRHLHRVQERSRARCARSSTSPAATAPRRSWSTRTSRTASTTSTALPTAWPPPCRSATAWSRATGWPSPCATTPSGSSPTSARCRSAPWWCR